MRAAKKVPDGHAREQGVERAGAQSIAVALQLVEHPLAVDAVLGGVMEDVDLPEAEQEFPNHWVAHDACG